MNDQEVKQERATARYDTLLKTCREAFTDTCYDASFHSLAAALHCAKDLGSLPRLRAVEKLATEHLARIDKVAPSYHHSTVSSASRGNASPLASLAKQAHLCILAKEGSWQR